MMPSDAADAATVLTLMLHAIDARDWAGVRQTFADQISIDYSALFGVPAATVDAGPHVAGWQSFAQQFDATQHVTGPIVASVDGESVFARTHVRAYHRMRNEVWMVAGHYEARLQPHGADWKIAALTLRVFYQEGTPPAQPA